MVSPDARAAHEPRARLDCIFACAMISHAPMSLPVLLLNTSPGQVRLRSFSTKVHKVDAMVSYKADDL